jgi:hypothetical protein
METRYLPAVGTSTTNEMLCGPKMSRPSPLSERNLTSSPPSFSDLFASVAFVIDQAWTGVIHPGVKTTVSRSTTRRASLAGRPISVLGAFSE